MELELTGLREGADRVVAFVRAQGADQEERLLDVVYRIRQAMRRGAHRGAVGALAFVQYRLGYELGTGDLPGDATTGALEDFEDDFGMDAEAMVDLVPLKDVTMAPLS